MIAEKTDHDIGKKEKKKKISEKTETLGGGETIPEKTDIKKRQVEEDSCDIGKAEVSVMYRKRRGFRISEMISEKIRIGIPEKDRGTGKPGRGSW